MMPLKTLPRLSSPGTVDSPSSRPMRPTTGLRACRGTRSRTITWATMTQDNLGNTYSYDAEGQPVSAGCVQPTFDAFGRALELNHSGTYTEMVYLPSIWRHAVMI